MCAADHTRKLFVSSHARTHRDPCASPSCIEYAVSTRRAPLEWQQYPLAAFLRDPRICASARRGLGRPEFTAHARHAAAGGDIYVLIHLYMYLFRV